MEASLEPAKCLNEERRQYKYNHCSCNCYNGYCLNGMSKMNSLLEYTVYMYIQVWSNIVLSDLYNLCPFKFSRFFQTIQLVFSQAGPCTI